MKFIHSAAAITLATPDLMPPHWLHGAWGDDFAIYNPAIVRYRDRLLLAYRVDLGRGPTMQRKIGLCELTTALQIIPDSVQALSDTIQDGHPQHYDPRFLIYQDRLFIHYNNNFQTRPNQLFMVELDPDTLVARSFARPLHLVGPRQMIEKNWIFFAHNHELFAVYQIVPHIILKVSLAGKEAIECQPIHPTVHRLGASDQSQLCITGQAEEAQEISEFFSYLPNFWQIWIEFRNLFVS